MESDSAKLATCCKIIFGCAVFAASFNAFLIPNSLNAGGISGISMMLVRVLRGGSVGLYTGILNLPLFAVAGFKIGKRFIWLSLLGMVMSSIFIDLMSFMSISRLEPVVGALYGGAFCGLGIGIVFSAGGSTGGSDIVIRLLKLRWRNVPIGLLTTGFDIAVALLTGIVYKDPSNTLYSVLAIVVSGQVIDTVLYRFDYSKVVWIICKDHRSIVDAIAQEIGRGATLLYGEGSYMHKPLKIVLTAVKRQELPKLKQVVSDCESDAFVIVQNAHQVLGDGFSRRTGENI